MRIGIIGCGAIGDLRAQSITQVPGAELRVVCDADAPRARGVAARYGCEAATAWPETVARRDLDVIVVSTPNDLHAEIALAAMRVGKHVLCEKPLARTPEECRRMVAAAGEHRVRLMTGFNHRRLPPMLKAKALLDDGAIGEPLTLRGWIGHEGGPEFLKRWVVNPSVSGGGTLVDNGVHLVDLVRLFLGEVVEVQGTTRTALWEIRPCEDQALALLHTQPGAVAFIMATWTEWRGYYVWLQITGTRGTITAQYPPMLTVLARRPENGRGLRPKRFFFPRDQVIERFRSYRWTAAQTFARELDELGAAIRDGREARPSGYDGLRVMEIIEAVYRSAREGCRVGVAPQPPR